MELTAKLYMNIDIIIPIYLFVNADCENFAYFEKFFQTCICVYLRISIDFGAAIKYY